MKQYLSLQVIVLVALLASGCEEAVKPATTTESTATDAPIDESRFIRSTDLHQRMQGDALNYVFDVRAKASYAESHIDGSLSMPYGIVGQEEVAALSQITLDTPIVTYCGCPHALAGLAADQLIEWGYRNVRVLHEGYWYWRDNNYPVVGKQAQSITVLRVSGLVEFVEESAETNSLFIRNLRNEQLEVALIGTDGRFQTEFHVLDYQINDRFEVRVGGLDHPVVGQLDVLDEDQLDHWISVKL